MYFIWVSRPDSETCLPDRAQTLHWKTIILALFLLFAVPPVQADTREFSQTWLRCEVGLKDRFFLSPSLASPALWDQVVSVQVFWDQVASLTVWPQTWPLQPPQPLKSEKLVTFTFTFLFTLRQVVERQPETCLKLSQAKTACLSRWKITSLLGGLSYKIF